MMVQAGYRLVLSISEVVKMAFTWTYSFAPGERILADAVNEIKNNIDSIASRVGMSLTWNYNPVSPNQIITTEQMCG